MKTKKEILYENGSQIINLYNSGSSIQKIVKIYGIHKNLISNYLKENNITVKNNIKIEFDYDYAIKLFNDGYSLNKISQILNIRRSKIANVIKDADIKIPYHEKFKFLNKDYFSTINSNEKAYFLGFIYADGHINIKRNSLKIDLSSKDSHILQSFSDILYGNNYVKTYTRNDKNYAYLQVVSKQIVSDLKNSGLKQQKTCDLQFPNIEEKYWSHFMRGLIDGDGCIYPQKPLINLICTKDIARFVIDNIFSKFKFRSSEKICQLSDGVSEISSIRLQGISQSKIFLDWLYQDSTIHLHRKYEKYQQVLNLFESKKKKC